MIVTDKIAQMMIESDRKRLKILLPEERKKKFEMKSEKEFQQLCENWLTQHGFRRRTPSEIARPGHCDGWFIHMHQCKKNPIILDLLILFKNGTYREIELKVQGGTISEEQVQLVARGGFVCYSLESFIDAVKQ